MAASLYWYIRVFVCIEDIELVYATIIQQLANTFNSRYRKVYFESILKLLLEIFLH